MTKTILTIEKIKLNRDSYLFNEFITLFNEEDVVRVEIDNNESHPFESNIYIFYRSLQLALSEVNLKVEGDEFLEEYNTYLLNYYGDSGDELTGEESETIIVDDTLVEKIKKCFEIVIEHNKLARKSRDKNSWIPSRWDYSYQNYLSACHAITIDLSILSLITGFESLLVQGEGSLSYKVSLYASLLVADDIDERRKIYTLIKKMYNFRSKVVHGEVVNVAKLSKNQELYKDYFKLKSILSKLLIITYGIPENALFTKIDNMIFECPSSGLN